MMALIFGCLNFKNEHFLSYVFCHEWLTFFGFRMGHKMTLVRCNFHATMG